MTDYLKPECQVITLNQEAAFMIKGSTEKMNRINDGWDD